MNESKLVDLNPTFKNPIPQKIFFLTKGLVEHCLAIPKINHLYETISTVNGPEEFCRSALRELNIRVQLSESDRMKIPREGPLVIVANHPFGALEGVALAKILLSVRPDVKFIANYLLGQIAEFRELFFLVDPFGNKDSVQTNMKALKQAMRWVEGGGALAVFPAGEVSHLNIKEREILDPQWSESVAAIIKRNAAPVLPVFVHGQNSALFQVSGLAHPRLRTALLGHEIFKRKDKEIRFSVGNLIPFEKLGELKSNSELIDYIRFRTYLLKNRSAKPLMENSEVKQGMKRPIASAHEPFLQEIEVDSLPAAQRLCESGENVVYFAHAAQIPHLLYEIGRLREITFRNTGEGTGRSLDLDEFDYRYLHLFIWNRSEKEIVGAYRLGLTDGILPRWGSRGLYTSTLFSFRPEFFSALGPAIELGRSFVTEKYQKSFSPLLLLWQGIARLVVSQPQNYKLFGPVSISRRFPKSARDLILRYLYENNFDPELARWVKPKSNITAILDKLKKSHERFNPYANREISEISNWIADIYPGMEGVPILLKQYLKLGGKILGFNLDPNFNNCMDCLVMVDLKQCSPNILKRYTGEAGLKSFRRYHQLDPVLDSNLENVDLTPAKSAIPC